jgi:hypothetical protein
METDFLKTLVAATGLPESLVIKELTFLANQRGLEIKDLDLDKIRSIMAEYLQKELLKAKRVYSY